MGNVEVVLLGFHHNSSLESRREKDKDIIVIGIGLA